jgi:hydrogenase maturation protease
MTTPKPIPLLVLGLGNLLLGDDGLGAVAVHLLNQGYEAPTGVTVLDGGTLGLSLLPYLEDSEAAILIDAIRADGPTGQFVRITGDEVAPAVATRLSPHQIGVADLLDGARWHDRYPRTLVLLGLIPAELELGVKRSPEVEAAIPGLIERVVDEARSLGFPFARRALDASAPQGPLDPGAVYGL